MKQELEKIRDMVAKAYEDERVDAALDLFISIYEYKHGNESPQEAKQEKKQAPSVHGSSVRESGDGGPDETPLDGLHEPRRVESGDGTGDNKADREGIRDSSQSSAKLHARDTGHKGERSKGRPKVLSQKQTTFISALRDASNDGQFAVTYSDMANRLGKTLPTITNMAKILHEGDYIKIHKPEKGSKCLIPLRDTEGNSLATECPSVYAQGYAQSDIEQVDNI